MRGHKITRRTALATTLAAPVVLNRMAHAAGATSGGRHHTYPWINQLGGTRPEFVWENREDAIYHEIIIKDAAIQRAPEFWALMANPWVFNRNMHWHRTKAGPIVAYETGGTSFVTGERGITSWFSDPENQVSARGDSTTFVQRAQTRRRDAAVAPSLQIHLGQHPTLRLQVTEATDDWQFVVSQKGRSGPPLLSSGWQRGPATIDFDLATEMRKRGFSNPYAEIHLVMGVWASVAGGGARVTFALCLPAQAAVVANLPVIRTVTTAQEGFPIAAAVVDADGVVLQGRQAQVTARVRGQRVRLHSTDGVYSGRITGLPIGDHPVTLEARSPSGEEIAASAQIVARVARDGFFTYDKKLRAVRHRGRIRKPLTGSFQGTFFVRDVGLPTEKMMQSQAQWDAWPRNNSPGEHQHYWEALNDAELDERFARLASCGWDLLHLHSHYGIWERFDAGGAIAPHAADQLARYVRIADRHRLGVMVTLSSYPYCVAPADWSSGTNPWQSYIDAGFKNEHWFDPKAQPFNTLYHRYLADITQTFAHETAIFSLSSSGEGDWKAGRARLLDTMEVVRKHDRSHLMVSEPVNMVEKLLTHQTSGFPTDLVGNRTYCLGWNMPFEVEMGLVFRMNQMVPNMYLAEGCYPSSNAYTRLVFPPGEPEHTAWVGTRQYRLNVRDVLYLGLIAQQPVLMTWDEAFTEDEHIVLRNVSDRFDWARRFRAPLVAICINDKDAHEKGRVGLQRYEATFSHLGLDYRFIEKITDAKPTDWIIDHTSNSAASPPDFRDLPAHVVAAIPVTPASDYAVAHAVHEDGLSGLAYFYNTAGHLTRKTFISPTYHRNPKAVPFSCTFGAVAVGKPFELWNLSERKVVAQGTTKTGETVDLGPSADDYLLAWGLAP